MATVRNLGNPSEPVDRRYASYNRIVPTTSIAITTPLYAGEKIISDDTGARFVGIATVPGAWGKVLSKFAGGSSSGGFPDPTNSGVPAGTVLTPFSGVFQVNTPGAVIDSVDIQGELIINQPGVTIKRCRIRGETFHLCRVNLGGDQVRFEDCTIDGINNTTNTIALFGTQDVVIIRCDIRGSSNGVTVGMNNTLVQDCYIHDLLDAHEDPHYDGVDNGGGANFMTVRHCRIMNPNAQTSCISMFQDFGVPHDNLVENCYLAGGGYCIYGGGGGLGTPNNIVIRNNIFGKDYYPNGGFFGQGAAWVAGGPGNVWTGNTWSDGGVVPAP